MKRIDEALSNFLTDKAINVVALKGPWGIGKTFFWRRFLNSHRGELPFRGYSYVSLFGLKDLQDLDRQIFTNFEILDRKGLSKHLEKVKPISNLLREIQIPYVRSTSAVTDLVQNKLVNNFLICLDDLERKEKSVSTSSVMGLVSRLKDEHNCKVLLIYNDTALDDQSAKDIKEYREKVVDLELSYSPSIDDNLKIIWPDDCPDQIAGSFKKIKLNNIRIMQRVKWAEEYFRKAIEKPYPHLMRSFQRNTACLTIIYHGFNNQIALREAVSTTYLARLFRSDSDIDEKLRILKDLEYIPEEQDSLVVEYLTTGFVDWAQHATFLQSLNEKYRLSDVSAQHREIWRVFHSGFAVTQAEFITMQKTFLSDHWSDLTLAEVASTIEFLEGLDASLNLTGLLDKAIERFVIEARGKDLGDLILHLPKALQERLQRALSVDAISLTIPELFTALAGSDSWNPQKIKHMLRFSETDYYDWITSEKTLTVTPLLKEFLRRFGLGSEDEKLVVSRLRAALEKVKERSVLDRRRVEVLIEGKGH